MNMSVPPLSLYVHLPWCVQKCPYCDFNSHELRTLPESDYVHALERDIQQTLARDAKHAAHLPNWPNLDKRPVSTVFFGGGTPSLFSAKSIEAIIELLKRYFNFMPEAEVTLEANPGTAEADKFSGFFSAGVNRLSLGVQSFDAQKLKILGRIHDDAQALRAIEFAHRAGFAQAKGINIDLMFGLPDHTLQGALSDLNQAISCAPTHISHYQLTLEPGTAFFYRPPALPKDDDIWDMQTACQARLKQAGFEHYEVSAYAQKGKRCLHNINYWQYGDYVGLGAGAHGKLSYGQAIHRISKVKSPDKYMRYAGTGEAVDQALDVRIDERAFEFMMNALRLVNGFDLSLFENRTGLCLQDIQPQIDELKRKGLIEIHDLILKPTEQGERFLNIAIEAFL